MGDKTENGGGALEGFSFDTNETFFGIKPTDDDFGAGTIKEVKGNEINQGQRVESTDIQKAGSKVGTTINDPLSDDGDGVTGEGEGEHITFFDDPPPVDDKPKVDEPKAGDKPKDEKKDEKVKEPKEPKADIKAAGTPAEPTPTGDALSDEDFYTNLASDLKSKGIYPNLELKDGEKINEDQFFEIIEADIESRAEENVAAFAENLDADAKAFIKFKRNGGKTSEFFATYNPSANYGAVESFDPKNDKHVETALTNYYTRVKKLDAEEVTEMIEDLKTRGALATRAAKANQELEDLDKKAKEELDTKTETNKKAKADGIKAFNEALLRDLNAAEAVGMFVLSEKDQKELAPYMTKATVKAGKDQYVPEFQRDLAVILRGETKEDRWKLAIFAKLTKNNFELQDVKVKAETKVTQTTKSKLRQQKEGGNLSTSGSYGGKKELSDYF